MGNYVHKGYPEKTESCFYLRKLKNCQKIIMEFRVIKIVGSFYLKIFSNLKSSKVDCANLPLLIILEWGPS